MTKINKIPVLDNGHVRAISFCPPDSELESIKSSYFRNTYSTSMLDITSVMLEVKCPYFILIPLISSGVKAASSMSPPRDAYVPAVDTIKSGNHASDVEISQSISMTIDSLMLNQKAYTHDGCNQFVASLTTPVAAYWEGVMQASLPVWLRFTAAKNLHPLVNEYQRTIYQVISSEYKNIHDIQKRVLQ